MDATEAFLKEGPEAIGRETLDEFKKLGLHKQGYTHAMSTALLDHDQSQLRRLIIRCVVRSEESRLAQIWECYHDEGFFIPPIVYTSRRIEPGLIGRPELYEELMSEFSYAKTHGLLSLGHFSPSKRDIICLLLCAGNPKDMDVLSCWFTEILHLLLPNDIMQIVFGFIQGGSKTPILSKEYTEILTDYVLYMLAQELAGQTGPFIDKEGWAASFYQTFCRVQHMYNLPNPSLIRKIEATLESIPSTFRYISFLNDNYDYLWDFEDRELIFKICMRHMKYMSENQLLRFRDMFIGTALWLTEIDEQLSEILSHKER